MRRLYSTFAGGWPGIGLLVMRQVVGWVLLVSTGLMQWSDPPSYMTLAAASLAILGLLLVAGLWTPVVGAVVALIQISQSLKSTNTHQLGTPHPKGPRKPLYEVVSGHRCEWSATIY